MPRRYRRTTRSRRRTGRKRTRYARKAYRKAPRRRIVRGTDNYSKNPLLLLGLKHTTPYGGDKGNRRAPTPKLVAAPKYSYFEKMLGTVARGTVRSLGSIPKALGLIHKDLDVAWIRENFPGHFDQQDEATNPWLRRMSNIFMSHYDGIRREGDLIDEADQIGDNLLSVVPLRKALSEGVKTLFPDGMEELLPNMQKHFHSIQEYGINLPEFVEDGLDTFSEKLDNLNNHTSLRNFAMEDEVTKVIRNHDFLAQQKPDDRFYKPAGYNSDPREYSRSFKSHTPLNPPRGLVSPIANRLRSKFNVTVDEPQESVISRLYEREKIPLNERLNKLVNDEVSFTKKDGYTKKGYRVIRNKILPVFLKDVGDGLDDLPDLELVPINWDNFREHRDALNRLKDSLPSVKNNPGLWLKK